MAEDAEPVRGFDAARLIADLRRGDPAAIAEAYARTFGSDLGRMVLAHHAAECGVGEPAGAGVSSDDRHYVAGKQDAALLLMGAAGFGQYSAVLAVMTDEVEGREDDVAFNHSYTPHPDEEF